MKATILISLFALLLAGCSVATPDLVYVHRGSFQMGNTFEGGDEDERPVHEVQLDSFLIGKHEVTVGQFKEFIRRTGYVTTAERGEGARVFVGTKVEKRPDANWTNPYFPQDDEHPVVCVSWYDAVAYCNWLSQHEGLEICYHGSGDTIRCNLKANGYRLPTEAEWEYAARSRGKEYRYAWGNGEPYVNGQPAGNTKDEAAKREWGAEEIWAGYDDGYAWTASAGSFAPNKQGIHDLGGNVCEWCWDWYAEEYYANSPVKNPAGPRRGTQRACRDCSFACPVYEGCVAMRGKAEPALAFSWGGFRVARSAR
jgi:formylglycine-generating enzyme required for sulfatase activity